MSAGAAEAGEPDEVALLTHYTVLSQAALNDDKNEAVLEGFKAIYGETRSPELSFRCAVSLSSAYSGQRDYDTAVEWARRAVDQAVAIGNIEWSWTAAMALTMFWRDRLINTRTCSINEFDAFDVFVTSWVEKVGGAHHINDRLEMLGIMAQVRGAKSQQVDGLDKKSGAGVSLAYLERRAANLLQMLPEGAERLAALADIQFRSAYFYSCMEQYANAIACFDLAYSMFTKLGKSRQARRAQMQRVRIRQLFIYEAYVGETSLPNTIQNFLNESLSDMDNVEKNLLETGMRLELVNCRHSKALVWEHAHRLGQAEALGYALQEIEQAEEILNCIRSDMTLRKDEEMLKHKAALTTRGAVVHEVGVSLSLKAGQIDNAWEWVQRGKARSFLDLLSFEDPIPASLLDTARAHEAARSLLNRESELVLKCETAPIQERFSIRQKLAACREEMASIAELFDIRLFRGQASLTKGCLKSMFPSRDDVVCVDWVLVDGVIYMFTVRPGDEPAVTKLSLSADKVSLWIRSNLKAEYLRQPRASENLRELDILVSPLSMKSKPGDLLVFCPASLLAGLPLHALQVDDRLLIERNTVIYAPSLTVLHHCVFRRPDDTVHLKKSVVFGNPSCDRRRAQESSESLAQNLAVIPYIGQQATKASFLHATQSPGLAFYHGHAAFDASDPLRSALILSHGDSTEPASRYLTAREILQTHLKPMLFVLIACESAKQELQAGEEPSGLLPMLMLAGVNSVIGTLWKCSDVAGKGFAEALFEALPRRNAKGERMVFDIAAAVQRAALIVRETRPAPYFWAPFVLSGSWQCWVTSE